jgi:hypothetical protein
MRIAHSLSSYHLPPAAADDIVNARIYEGIHFRTGDLMGRKQGEHVANWAFENFLKPLDVGQ